MFHIEQKHLAGNIKFQSYYHYSFFRTQSKKNRRKTAEDHVYYNTRNSIPVAVVSPTVTTQHVEDEGEEPRYITTDNITTEDDDHDYSEATLTTPHTNDVYAVPNRPRDMRLDSSNNVTLVDNDVYTEDHGGLTQPSVDNSDVTIVDNVIYTESQEELSDPENVYYNTQAEVINKPKNYT